jgi:hypothetical protein
MKVRGGHPFGLVQIPKNAKFRWFKWQNSLAQSFYRMLYQPNGVPTPNHNFSGTGGIPTISKRQR